MKFKAISICALACMFVFDICIAQDTKRPPDSIIDGRHFDINKIPITDARYMYALQGESKTLLSNKPFLELSPSQLQLLTGESNFSSEKMINLEVENAEKYCEYLSRWLSHDANDKYARDELTAHKIYIAYLKSLQSPLRPYLVKTQLYYRQTGRYLIYLRGDVLDVFHSSLGSKTTKITNEYLIIFVEKSIKDVNVNADVAS